MKMMNKDHLKGFVIGVLSVMLCGSLVGGALAATTGTMKTIQVMVGGISLFVEGKPFAAKDAHGNPIEPIIYEGTTYLPLRAVAAALDKEITYDGKTSSVYIGKMPGGKQIPLEELKESDSLYSYVDLLYTSFTMKDKTITGHNRLVLADPEAYITYNLNAQYRSIDGEFAIPYVDDWDDRSAKIKFYSVAESGEETLLAEFTTTTGKEPVKISVDLHGVNTLKIRTEENFDQGVFYNMTITEMD